MPSDATSPIINFSKKHRLFNLNKSVESTAENSLLVFTQVEIVKNIRDYNKRATILRTLLNYIFHEKNQKLSME